MRVGEDRVEIQEGIGAPAEQQRPGRLTDAHLERQHHRDIAVAGRGSAQTGRPASGQHLRAAWELGT